MAKGVASDVFRDAGPPKGLFDGPLENRLVYVVTTLLATLQILPPVLLMKEDEPLHLMAIRLFGARAVMAGPQGLAHAVEKLWLLRFRWSRCGRSGGRTCRCSGWGYSHSMCSPAVEPGHGIAGLYSYLYRKAKVNNASPQKAQGAHDVRFPEPPENPTGRNGSMI